MPNTDTWRPQIGGGTLKIRRPDIAPKEMATPLADICPTAFTGRDKLLAAMAAIVPPIRTYEDFRAYNGRKLMSTPPDDPTLAAMLALCTAKDSDVKDDVTYRTAFGYVHDAVTERATGTGGGEQSKPAADPRAAHDFATNLYNELGTKMVSRVPNEDRIEGTLVKETHDDLNKGVLKRAAYDLASMRGVLQH